MKENQLTLDIENEKPACSCEGRGVVVDLETMGLESNAAIISIGAVKFDINDGIISEFYTNVSLKSSVANGLRINPDTIMWWLDQSDGARRALLEKKGVDLTVALQMFMDWYNETPTYKTVWGHGAGFDNVILKKAMSLTGISPWGYRDDRCYRTLLELYKNRVPKPDIEIVEHNALEDARYEALHLIDILRYIDSCEVS